MSSTADKKITLTLKEILGLLAFVLSIGISIGGFISVLNKIGELGTQQKVLESKLIDLDKINIQNAAEYKQMNKTLEEIKVDLKLLKNGK